MNGVSRVGPGVIEGGQYTTRTRLDPKLHLALDEPTEVLSPTELWEQAQESSKYWSGRLGVDAEDLRSSAILAFYEAADTKDGSSRTHPDAAPSDAVVANPRGYIHATARNIATRMLYGTVRAEDRRATTMYRDRVAVAEQKLRRSLRRDEQDAIADEIRVSMPPRRRPSPDFHRAPRYREVPLRPLVSGHDDAGNEWADRPAAPGHDDAADEWADRPAATGAPETNSQEFAAGSVGEEAERILDRGGRSNHVQARARAYDMMAEKCGGPAVARGAVTEYAAQNARKAITEAGGPTAVIAAWRAGDSTAEQEKALFAPFAVDTMPEGRRAAADTLAASGAYCDDVWAAALTVATRPHGAAAGAR